MNRFILRKIDEQLLDAFIAFSEKEGKKEIFLDSEGGFIDVIEAIVYIINSSKEDYKIIVHGRAHSAAFAGLLNVECEIEILPTALSCIHLPSYGIETRELRDPRSESNFVIQKLSPIIEEFRLSKYKKYFNEEEFSYIKEGKEVWIDSIRLKEIINKRNECKNSNI